MLMQLKYLLYNYMKNYVPTNQHKEHPTEIQTRKIRFNNHNHM